MSERLFESDFLAVDLRSILQSANEKSTATTSPEVAADAKSAPASNSLPDNMADCTQILKDRLADNSKLGPEARKPESEIEIEFCKEFFKKFWDPTCAQQLILMGEALRKVLKVVGCDPNKNPLLMFLTQSGVKERLLQTKLLNVDTFKAIYNAVVKKTVAQGQFMRENPYNIIYCPDLYRKTAKEIETYLELQKQILEPSEAGLNYDVNTINLNRKTFLTVPSITEPDINKRAAALKKLTSKELPSAVNAKLNSLTTAQAIYKKLSDGSQETKVTTLASDDITALANKLNTRAKKLAAIMSLSVATNSDEAKAAALSAKFKGVTAEELQKATLEIAPIMPKGQLSKSSVNVLVSTLLSQI